MKINFRSLLRSGVHAATISSLTLATMLLAASCTQKDSQPAAPTVKSVLVFSEGQYQASNASIISYDPDKKVATLDIFGPANGGAKLGDVPSSATMYDGRLLVPISGSGKVYAIDPVTGKLLDKLTEVDSPRYISIINDHKAYLTNLNTPKITIFDPSTFKITGSIDTPTAAEMLVKVGDYIYANLWSYGNQLIKIDPNTDKIVNSIKVGSQPLALLADKTGMLWAMCDGAQWNPAMKEPASIVKVDPEKMAVVQKLELPAAVAFSMRMVMDNAGENIYYMTDAIYKMATTATALPTTPLVTFDKGVSGYSLGINPANGDLYVGDAIDYTQRGVVYRYTSAGVPLDKFTAGIVPSFYYFSSK